MKRIINVCIFCAGFLVSFHIFGGYLIKLISLKMEHEKVTGTITALPKTSYTNGLLRIEYHYDYMGKKNTGRISVSSGLLKSLYKTISFNNYYIGQRIYVLVKPDNTFTFLEEEIDSEIVKRVLLLLSLPLLITFLIKMSLLGKYLKKTDKKTGKTRNKKTYYTYYTQGNDYNIKEENIGEKISLEDIAKYMDYNALRNNDVICCGIERDDDFVEVSFAGGQYQLRIAKKGNEKTETTGDYAEINEIMYRNINR